MSAGSGSQSSLKTESNAESLSSAPIVTSNWDKFCLLLWKNWIVQWQHKFMLVFEIIMPVIYTLILVVFRASLVPERVPVMEYSDIPVNNLDILISYLNNSLPVNITWGLAYSPASPIFKNIMEEVQLQLEIPDLVNQPNSVALEQYCLANNMIACVEFPDNLSQDPVYPNNFKYALRFPSDLRTASRLSTDNWETNQLFPTFIIRGSRNTFDDDGGLPPGYIREGFIAIQNAINRAYISQVKEYVTHIPTNVSDLPEVFMHRYPYPSFMQDYFLESLEIWLPFIVLVSFLYPCTFGVKAVTVEKEQQLKEVMKIMGLDNWLHWVAWFVKSFSILFISSALIVIILKVPWTDGAAVLTTTNWFPLFILLLVYSVVSVCFAFMISVFFSSASTATAVTALLWFVCYLPYAFTVSNYNTLTLGDKMGCSLLSNSAMGFAFTLIIQWEGIGTGLQWDNFFTPATPDDTFSVGLAMVMMLVSSVLYMTICVYVEQIMPGEFGVPKKWYFPFTKSYWFKGKSLIDNEIQSNGIEQPSNFEYVAPGKYAGLKIRNLRKTFGKKVAVKGINLNMYESEITVLLGHNGAGKTTTISMLTGMFPPTSGTAVLNEADIRTNIESVRQSLGFCPQHNILFDELTVREHIIFFSWLKGVRKDNLNSEVEKYTKILQLEDKIDTQSCKLSGGMKRKLSVGSAFCGGTKVVLCDEPSSGMDPSARRQMWDLLQSEKQGRTVLLTTHFMDEADVLGDRIAIMGAGEVKCYGTSFFLKKKFGSGYILTCVKTDMCDSSNVSRLLRKYIPNIQIQQEIGAELSYQLPDEYTSKFEDMLSDLEKHSSDLFLNGYGISNSSLEDVFMKMGAEVHDDTKENSRVISNLFGPEVAPLLKGYTLEWNQWKAMLLKKYIYSVKNWIIVAIQFIVPLIFVILTIEIEVSQSTYKTLKALNISMWEYKNTMTVLSTNGSVKAGTLLGNTADQYDRIMSSLPSQYQYETTALPFPTFILDLATTQIVDINTKYMVAASIGPKNITAWFNNQPYHTAPLTLNLIYNALLRAYMGSEDYSIEVINHPLPFGAMTEFQQLASGNNLGTQLSSNLCFCMSFITSLVSLFIIRERVTRAKLLQYVAGIRIPIFWITQFLWDYLLLIITSLLIILVIACFQQAGYTTFSELGKNFAILLIFGLPAIPWTYLLTKYFDEPAAGFARISMINLIVGLIFFILVTVLASPIYNDKDTADGLSWFFMIFPHFSLAQSLNKLSTNIITHSVCDSMCDLIQKDGACDLELICEKTPTCCEMVPYWAWDQPGVLPETIYMIVMFFVFFGILILREMKMLGHISTFIMEKYKGKPQLPEPTSKVDDDVLNEKYRVAAMSDCELELQNLVLDRATKFYDRFLAVNQISVAVKPMECFGLLGVNGAGKTTTFKMMTGDESLSSGNGFVEGLSIISDMRNVYKKLGYCPQFDALLGDLSGRETIRIFGMIRGLTPEAIAAVTKTLSVAFGFQKHIDKPVKAYSGGNKRKLSTAIALIGNPSVVFLDEPTSGMDPASRRNLWNVVCNVRDSGKSIVLTSHSMEECEALCTRLAIMVNGEFKCLGSTQHLKNKFSRGLILKMKLKRQISSQDDEINYKHFLTDLQNINEFISCHFPEARLQEQYQGILTFCVPLTSIKWSTIFGLMERNRHRFNIEDYSINQTTLEEIFLEFAKHQREEDTRDYSQSKGCFSCYQKKQ